MACEVHAERGYDMGAIVSVIIAVLTVLGGGDPAQGAVSALAACPWEDGSGSRPAVCVWDGGQGVGDVVLWVGDQDTTLGRAERLPRPV